MKRVLFAKNLLKIDSGLFVPKGAPTSTWDVGLMGLTPLPEKKKKEAWSPFPYPKKTPMNRE